MKDVVPASPEKYDRKVKRSEGNKDTYEQIQTLKAERDLPISTLYSCQSYKIIPEYITAQRTKNVIETKKVIIDYAENIQLPDDSQHLSDSFIFSGTDNGIVKTIKSISVTFDKFKYHLTLYNHFAGLEGVGEPDFEPLDEPVTAHAGVIDPGVTITVL